jgi:hypothetical protein
MKKVFTKKFWTVLISAPVIGGIVFACAGGDYWAEYGTSNFTPEAFVEKKYSPFFYSSYNYYYGIGHETDQVNRFNSANVSDWSSYMGDTSLTTELHYLLNESAKETVDSVKAYIDGENVLLPQSVAAYQLFKIKNEKKVKNFIYYLSLAKESAVFANAYSGWDYDPAKLAAYPGAPVLTKSLQTGFDKAADGFLKQRYWFQLVRCCFFNGQQQHAIDVFEANGNKFERNVIYYRTQAYAAGAYYRQKNYSKANYYYSLVYNACDELKTAAHFSFHPQDEKDWNATLAFSKNNEERITLWQMLGVFYGDEKRSIQEILKLEPSSSKLNLLLARAVNKEEQKLNASYDGLDAAKIAAIKIDKDLLELVSSTAKKTETNDPFMWNAAAGYLLLLNQDYKEAEIFLQAAEKNAGNEKLKQWQLRLLKALHKVAAAVKVDGKLENEVLGDVEWLRTYSSGEGDVFRHADAFTFIKSVMAKKYRAQEDFVKSECYVTKSSFYRDDKNVEAMKSFLQKTDITAYEKLCKSLYNKNLDDLNDYQGVRLTYNEKFDQAIAALEKSGDKATLELRGNPFNGKIKDCFDCDHASYKGTPYTKLILLKKMKEMQANVQSDNDVYNNALLLGNAFYNISFYGNARDFYVSSIPGAYQYTSNAVDSSFKDFLLNMNAAKTYYQKALAASTTNEQKAKCYYLLAKCERNEWYTKHVFTGDYYYGAGMIDLEAISNFRTLKQYSDTKYYQEVIKECGYFREFIKRN